MTKYIIPQTMPHGATKTRFLKTKMSGVTSNGSAEYTWVMTNVPCKVPPTVNASTLLPCLVVVFPLISSNGVLPKHPREWCEYVWATDNWVTQAEM